MKRMKRRKGGTGEEEEKERFIPAMSSWAMHRRTTNNRREPIVKLHTN